MKKTINYKTNDSILLVEEEQQLEMFELNNNNLKYPRRGKRRISNQTFELEQPNELTSNIMRKIQSKNTTIEIKFEMALIQAGLRYCKSEQLIETIEGNPDFVIPKYRIAIFCDGDFWHGYNFDSKKIKNNNEFWSAKIERNITHDSEVSNGLKKNMWKVFRFWEHDIKNNIDACILDIKNYIEENYSEVKYEFTFVDLFAGIGGFRIPLEELGGKCLGFSEIDKYAIETYKNNFWEFKNNEEVELGSITDIGKLPFNNIDLIVGGVPCQSWSVAGKMRGFDDPRGKLWHDTIRVVELNKPKAFIFENVKGLMDPRNRGNLELIIDSFEALGYIVKYQLLNSYDFGLPQNRDRIFIVGIKKELNSHKVFRFPLPKNKKSYLHEILDDFNKDVSCLKKEKFDPQELFGDKIPMGRNRFQKTNEFNDFFIFCDTRNGHTTIHSWDIIRTSKREKEICMVILRNRRKKIYGNADGNPLKYEDINALIPDLKESELIALIDKKILKNIDGQGYVFVNSKNSAGINGIYRIYLPHSNIFSTLTATGTKDVVALKNIHAKTPIEYKEKFINEIITTKAYRSISAREAGRLQGFPDWFAVHKNENLAKKQFGNAVSTKVIYNLAESLVSTDIFKSEKK
jgi:DNA (cytosine-5)-methyltransferase 1